MGNRKSASLAVIAAAFMLMAGLMFGARSGAAQDSTPTVTKAGHPVHIHKGTCSALGDIVFPLTDITEPGMMMGTPEAGMMATPDSGMMASPTAEMGKLVGESKTTVKAKLADIISGGHAINAHESVDKIQNYIACGEITGTPANNELKIMLAEQNKSGFVGTADLKDNGDGTTTVTLMLYSSMGMGTPMATPAS
ncbi:MAG: hypothetical protein ACR2OO_04055 [Thermomicrobiales bacterium]